MFGLNCDAKQDPILPSTVRFKRIQHIKDMRKWNDIKVLIAVISGACCRESPEFKSVEKEYGFYKLPSSKFNILLHMYATILELPIDVYGAFGYDLPLINKWQPAIDLKIACAGNNIRHYIEKKYMHTSREVQTVVRNIYPIVIAQIIAAYTIPAEYDAFVNARICLRNDHNDVNGCIYLRNDNNDLICR